MLTSKLSSAVGTGFHYIYYYNSTPGAGSDLNPITLIHGSA